MAGNAKDRQNGFVVLYLLIVLLGLTLAVTVFVYTQPEKIFPVYTPPQTQENGAPGPAGYTHVKITETGKLPLRAAPETLPINSFLSMAGTSKNGYTLTLTTTNNYGGPYVPTGISARIYRHGGKDKDKDAFTPNFKPQSSGVYTAHTAFPAPGQWDVHIRLHYDDTQYIKIFEFTTTETVK